MQHNSSSNDSSSQNIMAAILQSLPGEAGLTKIEYEGPRIALYSNNPKYLLENAQLVSNMVNTVKKRIVIRTDESIRTSVAEATKVIKEILSQELNLSEIFFDPALGEALIFVSNLTPASANEDDRIGLEIVEKTGWKVKIRKTPIDITAIKEIYDVLNETVNERIRFYRETGEKIFRPKLAEMAEASILSLGGFGEVGRSALLILTPESKILLDCGINIFAKDALNNYPRFDITGIKINEIDAIVISHAHLDHSGFIPILYKFGYKGPVYCSEPTLPLMTILQKRHMQSCENPSYSIKDINEAIMHSISLGFGVVTDISPDIKLALANSGHMLGSSSIHLHIGNGDHNLVYTGDMKFGRMLSVDNASWNFPRVETIIIESTFGSKEDIHPPREEAERILTESLFKTLSEKGKVLIPSPISGLSQEIIMFLNSSLRSKSIPEVPIIIDKSIISANSIYEIFPEYLAKDIRGLLLEDHLNPFRSEKFISANSNRLKKGPCIILSPSSMLIGGPSAGYLAQIAADPVNKLVLLGYSSPGTPARQIEEGIREITIEDKDISISCQVQKISGFSAHSDYNQLMAYLSRLRPKIRRILVNHGERSKVQNLASSANKLFKVQTQHPLVQEAIKLL